MTAEGNSRCTRCGRFERDDDQQARFEFEMALSADDPERRTDACLEDFATLRHLYETLDGLACFECLTLTERRHEDFQCGRCGAQFHDDGRDSDRGWIVEVAPNRLICPKCTTASEDAAEGDRLLSIYEAGKLRCEVDGVEYPADLEIAIQRDRRARELRREQQGELKRLLGGDS